MSSFGNEGKVDLRVGLGRDPNSIKRIASGSPGVIYDDLIIEGSSTGEDYGSPPGDIRRTMCEQVNSSGHSTWCRTQER